MTDVARLLSKLILIVITAGGLIIVALIALSPTPKYNLLFAEDFNVTPYSSPESFGVVIRVDNHQAYAVVTGKTRRYDEDDVPSLFICEAATGRLHEIHIPISPGNKAMPGDKEYYKFWGKPAVVIHLPELNSIRLDTSSVAPNGYSFRGIQFGKPYEIQDFLLPMPPLPFPFGNLPKNDTYKKCLQQINGNQAGLMLHLIGWITTDNRSLRSR